MSVRKARPEVRVTGLSFSPTGRSFAAASTEGLLIYSLDHVLIFDPFDLDVDVTPAATLSTLRDKGDYLKALVMAFRLNERYLIHQVYEAIPQQDIMLVVRDLPLVYLSKLIHFVTEMSEEGPHLEFSLLWLEAVISRHGKYIREERGEFETEIRGVVKCVQRIQNELARLADENVYTLEFLLSTSLVKKDVNEKMFIEDGDVGGSSEDVEMDGEGEW
jgi:periodic tryptophan protein 2